MASDQRFPSPLQTRGIARIADLKSSSDAVLAKLQKQLAATSNYGSLAGIKTLFGDRPKPLLLDQPASF
jgi:hypothetical protein